VRAGDFKEFGIHLRQAARKETTSMDNESRAYGRLRRNRGKMREKVCERGGRL